MRKSLISILIAFMILGLSIGFIGCSDDDDDDQLSSATDIITFMVENHIGEAQIDTENHTITVEVDLVDISALEVTIEVSPGATVDPESGSVVNFSDGPVIFTVTAEDGTTQEWTVTVTGQAPFQATFTVIDGKEEYMNVKFKSSYNEWALVPMNDPDSNHVWEVTIDSLPVGVWEWGAIEDDGSEWGIWLPQFCEFEQNPYDTTSTNPWFKVNDNGTVEGVMTLEIPAPAEGINVTFRVDMSPVEEINEDGVHLVGGFPEPYPNWNPNATDLLMTDEDEDDIYEITLELPGETTYDYKYLNGLSWDNEEFPVDNRTIEVGTEDYVIDPPDVFGDNPNE